MRAHEFHVGAGDGAHDDEGEAPRVDGAAGWDEGGEGFEEGFGGLEGLGGVAE